MLQHGVYLKKEKPSRSQLVAVEVFHVKLGIWYSTPEKYALSVWQAPYEHGFLKKKTKQIFRCILLLVKKKIILNLKNLTVV